MKKLLLVLMMGTWIVGCETSMWDCYGHWVKGPGHHRGTRHMLKDAKLPYYQCVDENPPHNDVQGKRRYL